MTAAAPILGPELPCADDIGFHLMRSAQLEHQLRRGVVYGRWASNMGLGYGYPLFNFVPPLPYYLVTLLASLGLGLNVGMRLTFALGLWGSGLAAYAFAREHFSPTASLVASVAYTYAPYQAYDILFRGNLPESLAWPFLPLALWALTRLARGGGRRWWVATALSYAAILLTHNIFTMIFTPLIFAYALLTAALEARPSLSWGDLKRVGIPLMALGLGMGLSAFYWVPAFFERGSVQLERLSFGFPFSYWHHYLSLEELFLAARSVHPDLLNPSPPRTLGLVATALGLVGWGGGLLGGERRRRTLVTFFVAFLLAYSFAMTAPSRPLWEHVPLVELIEFPWRLLGPAALCLAVLVASAVELLPARAPRSAFAITAITALILGALYWLTPHYCPQPLNPTAEDIAAQEARGRIGTTSATEYLPDTVSELPDETATEFFSRATLPATGGIHEELVDPLRARASVESGSPFTLTVNQFYFPGWQAWVDESRVPITPTDPHGLISFPIPAGRHDVRVRFGTTPLRAAATALSTLSLLALVAIAGFGPRGRPVKRDGNRLAWAWLLLPLAIVGLREGVLERVETPLQSRRLSEEGLADVKAPLDITFDGQLRILGHDGFPDYIPADRPLPLTLYVQDTQPGGPDYLVYPALTDAAGREWIDYPYAPTEYKPPPPGTSGWPPDAYVAYLYDLWPMVGTPPGTYTVTLKVYDSQSMFSYPAHDGERALGPHVVLGTVQVGRPLEPFSEETLGPPATWREMPLGPLELVHVELHGAQVRPGDTLKFDWGWKATHSPGKELRARVRLVSPGGTTPISYTVPLARHGFPTSKWKMGDVWRGQIALRLPANLEDGQHRLVADLCRTKPGGCSAPTPSADLGALQVKGWTRLWTAPPLEVRSDALLGERVTLLGANFQPPPSELGKGDTLTVTLAWRGEVEMETGYHVFLHLLDEGGQLVAQSDGAPVAWTRPTTGWLPGEVILDERELVLPEDLPAGTYRLVAGLYRMNGPRLITAGDEDAVELLQMRLPPGQP